MPSVARKQNEYWNPAIRKLRDDLVVSIPREELPGAIDRAEVLVGDIETRQQYAADALRRQVSPGLPPVCPNLRVPGNEARHDLQLMVQELSGLIKVPFDAAGQPVYTIRQLARHLSVSTKTISRWRRQGLISRRFVLDDRRQIGFLKSSVDRFIKRNPQRVERGTRFSQMSPSERRSILERARRLVAAGVWPSEITKQLAKTTGRSLETIRYTLKRFDRDHPDLAILPDHYGSLRLEMKRDIHDAYLRGESIDSLATLFCRTKSSIYRILAEMRARRILELPLEYVPNENFETWSRDKRTEREIIGPTPDCDEAMGKTSAPAGLPPYLAALYEVPLLTRDQEVHLFRKMNYLKYKACMLRERLTPARPRKGLMAQIDEIYAEIVATKNQIIRANLRLVVSIAKRHVGPAHNFFELVSDGNVSLMRAVERFDFALENKFSTYASWAIMKNFARTIPESLRQRDRFRTSHPDLFPATEDARTDQSELEAIQSQRENTVERILRRLDKREQEIITCRFGLRRGQEPLTLKQVGAVMGVTKERVRQIEARALNKLRAAVVKEKLSLLE